VIRAITKIAIGGGIAQAIQFLALPFLSIIYSPQVMGTYFTATMIASIGTVLLTFQLQHAIPNKVSSSEIHDLVCSIAFLATIITVILAFFFIFLNIQSKILYYWAIAFSFTAGFNNVVRSFLIRLGKLNLINIATFIRAIFAVVGQFVFNKIFGDVGIFIGFLIGDLSAVIIILYVIKADLKLKTPRKGFLSRTVTRQKNLFIFGTLQELVAVSTLSLPLIVITDLFGDVMGGQFGMAQRLMLPPAAIILGAIVNVIHHSYGRREKYAIVESSIIGSINICFFILFGSILAFLGARFVCDLILEPKWDLAVWTSGYIAIWSVFLVASAPFRACCRMYAKQHIQLSIDLLALTFLIASFIFGKKINLEYTDFVIIFVSIGVFQNFSIFLAVKIFVLR